MYACMYVYRVNQSRPSGYRRGVLDAERVVVDIGLRGGTEW